MRKINVPPKVSFRKRSARRRGVTIVVMALSMVCLLGFGAVAVDYGLLVNDANRMQRAADAAALSAANELCKSGSDTAAIASDTGRARALAVVTAARNGVTIDGNTQVSFPAYNRIRVNTQTTRNFFFARAIGKTSSSITRVSSAGRAALSGLTGASPLAITTDDFNTYRNGASFEVLLIRNQDDDFKAGTSASLDLRLDNSGKSGAVFQDDLQYGYTGQTVLGQPINSALTADVGSQGSKLEIAFDDRIDRAKETPWFDTGSNYTFPNYPTGDPRIVTIMVADPSPANNNNPSLTARAFINVYIENVRSPAHKNTFIRMRILPTVSYNSQDPNVILDFNAAITGPSAVVMMD